MNATPKPRDREPHMESMKTTEISVPAGTKLYLEDQIWEFDEPTTLVIEAPILLPDVA